MDGVGASGAEDVGPGAPFLEHVNVGAADGGQVVGRIQGRFDRRTAGGCRG